MGVFKLKLRVSFLKVCFKSTPSWNTNQGGSCTKNWYETETAILQKISRFQNYILPQVALQIRLEKSPEYFILTLPWHFVLAVFLKLTLYISALLSIGRLAMLYISYAVSIRLAPELPDTDFFQIILFSCTVDIIRLHSGQPVFLCTVLLCPAQRHISGRAGEPRRENQEAQDQEEAAATGISAAHPLVSARGYGCRRGALQTRRFCS